jgi:hypothetical protein
MLLKKSPNVNPVGGGKLVNVSAVGANVSQVKMSRLLGISSI